MDGPDDDAIELESQPKAKRRNGDRILGAVGFALATTAAFFPWYVFFNQESFGVNPMAWSNSRDLPETRGRSVVSVSPAAIPDEKGGGTAAGEFDPITTATVSTLNSEAPASTPSAAEPIAEQPYPGRARYHLLHVANGRALIEDPSGMYIVRVGSVLPDNSRLATMEKRDGKWVIVTSNGDVISD